jgi:nucleoside-diphosphate-sugar epimerase
MLVTGAAGKIGSKVVLELARHGPAALGAAVHQRLVDLIQVGRQRRDSGGVGVAVVALGDQPDADAGVIGGFEDIIDDAPDLLPGGVDHAAHRAGRVEDKDYFEAGLLPALSDVCARAGVAASRRSAAGASV